MKNNEDMVTRFDGIHERDWQQYKQTALMHNIVQQKYAISLWLRFCEHGIEALRTENEDTF